MNQAGKAALLARLVLGAGTSKFVINQSFNGVSSQLD
jgi:hypothetical protein